MPTPAQLSYAGTPITPERTKAALKACDRVLHKLVELFKSAPRRPEYIDYDLVVDENGKYRWVHDDVDLLIRQAIASAAKKRRHR